MYHITIEKDDKVIEEFDTKRFAGVIHHEEVNGCYAISLADKSDLNIDIGCMFALDKLINDLQERNPILKLALLFKDKAEMTQVDLSNLYKITDPEDSDDTD